MTAPAPEFRLPVLALLGSAALGLAMLAPFGTSGLPAAGRLLFWAALLFGNAWKWRQWFRRVPPLLPASRAALPILFVGGPALLGALLPIEFALLAWATGLPPLLPAYLPLVAAAALTAAMVVAGIIIIVRWQAARRDTPATSADQAL